MPPELRREHQVNDAAVLAACGFDTKATECEIVSKPARGAFATRPRVARNGKGEITSNVFAQQHITTAGWIIVASFWYNAES